MLTSAQMREVFHFRFLEQLLKVSDPKFYVLKGGVNLRFYFKSPRYSEDMDIDVLAGAVPTLKKNGYKILNDQAFCKSLMTYGISELRINDPLKEKHTDTSQKFGLQLITNSGEQLDTQVEFSRRELLDDRYVNAMIDPEISRRYGRLSFHCQHYTGEAAVLQKINALATRRKPQTRDVFDLHLLYLGGFAKRDEILAKTDDDKRKSAAQHVAGMTYEQYQDQVLEYLEEEERKQYEGRIHWENLQVLVMALIYE